MTIAVDFDGTLVEHAYPKIGREIPFAFEVLKKIQQKGKHQLVLWTVREGDLLNEAVEYCRSKGVEFYAVNSNFPSEQVGQRNYSRKLQVDLFIDDRNFGGLPNWGVIHQQIEDDKVFEADWSSLLSNQYAQTKLPKKKKNLFLRIGEAIDKL